MMRKPAFFLFSFFVAFVNSRGLTIEDVQSGYRISAPSSSFVSGLTVFSARRHDLENNEDFNALWMTPNNENNLIALTEESADHSDSSPFWMDSENVAFLSTRSGTNQLWEVNVSDRQPRQLTDFALGINHVKYHQQSGTLIFAARVFPNMTMQETANEVTRRENAENTGMIYDNLYIRFWDTYEDGRFSHLFSARIEPNSTTSDAIDLMAGLTENCPGRQGSNGDFDISPDGLEIAYGASANTRDEAWSSNIDVFIQSTDGNTPREQLTSSLATDESPRYSPDGTRIAFLANFIPRYGADFRRVMVYNRATRSTIQLTDADRSYGGLTWAADSNAIFATAQDTGRVPIFELDAQNGTETVVIDAHVNSNIVVHPDGRLIFLQQSLTSPVELFTVSNPSAQEVTQLTSLNIGLLDDVEMSNVEEFFFTGAENSPEVHGWLLRPHGYQPGQKYPLAFLIHGGPQSAFNDDWSYRWNFQVFAGQGYAVVGINPRGSTGYGQQFMDEILDNWGSLPYEDLMIGLDYVLEEYDFIDGEKMCALGASYGGYMTNWIRGHTDRFDCLVTHAGLYDLSNFWYITEILDFMENNNGGEPPFVDETVYQKYNPENHILNWKTPTLVTHGALDYRVPESHGVAVFQALQRMGVDSRYLLFPDENHWILKPENSVQWYDEVLRWLHLYMD